MKSESFLQVGHAFTMAEGLERSLDLPRHDLMQPIQNAWSHPVISPNLFPLFAIVSKHIPHSTVADASNNSFGKLNINLDFCSHIFVCWLASSLLWGCKMLVLQWAHGRPWASWQYSPYLQAPEIWYLHNAWSSNDSLILCEYLQAVPLLQAPRK